MCAALSTRRISCVPPPSWPPAGAFYWASPIRAAVERTLASSDFDPSRTLRATDASPCGIVLFFPVWRR